MFFTYCNVGCTKRSGRDKVSFYRIPTIVQHQGEKTAALSSKRRHDWIMKINRKEWSPTKNARVCSDRFVSGRMWSLLYQWRIQKFGKRGSMSAQSARDFEKSLIFIDYIIIKGVTQQLSQHKIAEWLCESMPLQVYIIHKCNWWYTCTCIT